MKLINKYANSRYSKMNEYYCGITTELDKLAGLDPNGHWKHYVLCDYPDDVNEQLQKFVGQKIEMGE